MCKHMVDGNEQKGHGKTTAVSEDAEAEIFITFKWKQYIPLVNEKQFQRKDAKSPRCRRDCEKFLILCAFTLQLLNVSKIINYILLLKLKHC